MDDIITRWGLIPIIERRSDDTIMAIYYRTFGWQIHGLYINVLYNGSITQTSNYFRGKLHGLVTNYDNSKIVSTSMYEYGVKIS